MDTKSLSSQQIRWAQELSQYHFQIDYCYYKANAAVDALLKFPQKCQNEENKLWAENSQIFHRLQNSLTNVSLASFNFSDPSHLHQVFICGTYVLSQLWQIWNGLRKELAQERPYIVGSMRLKLHKLQAKDEQA